MCNMAAGQQYNGEVDTSKHVIGLTNADHAQLAYYVAMMMTEAPITKNTTAVFVVYILQIHLPRWFSPTKKPVLLRLQYHDYFYHFHSKKYHSSNRSIIFIPHFMIE